MKSPEEIKKGLECCQTMVRCSMCTYNDIGCNAVECQKVLFGDSLVLINQLESREKKLKSKIAKLEQRLAQAERERDAAVRDLRDNYDPCDVCKKKNICEEHCPKNGYDCISCLDTERCIFYNCTKDNDLWQWRGVCEESSKEGEANEGRT